jgi:glutathione S-transferase
MGTLDRILAEQDYLLGSFSAADVAVGTYLIMIPNFTPDLDMTPWTNIICYMHRCVLSRCLPCLPFRPC